MSFFRQALKLVALLAIADHVALAKASNSIKVDGTSFSLNGDNVSYRFHVDNTTGEILTDHFGGPADEDGLMAVMAEPQGWVTTIGRIRREFPDLGRGDFRTPAVRILQSQGNAISYFQYQSHDVVEGKPSLAGLPSTFGDSDDVSTLVIHLFDKYSEVSAHLSYSIFPKYDAIVRSVNITNEGNGTITIEKLASFSIDLPYQDLDMLELKGDWAREAMRVRRKVDYGTQGFESRTGFSSHLYNPFLSLVSSTASESQGEAWGFSLVYSGSFAVEVEKGSQSLTRAVIGLNPYHLSYQLKPGDTFSSPECVAVYSDAGVGGMSRQIHRLYRKHLMTSKFATETRPPLLNSWEGLSFNINESSVQRLAQEAADLGSKLFVLDDGWFGNEYPRVADDAGLGDWQVNTERFPGGLKPLVDKITDMKVGNTSEKMKFGLWFEPEMVNPNSTLYHEHPDWALHAGSYPRSLVRNELVLNVAMPEVQEFMIESVSNILRSAPISYVKWDTNRGIQETESPDVDYKYMLGLYHVIQNLTSQFPDVLWEGCASGGGRFDPGILHWFPQYWTSDDTDAVERIAIQFGTSLVYPPSAMGAHISIVPNGVTQRVTPIHFRAHVAMMGGSFGLELDPQELDESDKDQIPGLIALAEKVNPIVIRGDLWRLTLPEESTHPAALFISEDGDEAVLFAFQTRAIINNGWPWYRLQGLDAGAKYKVNGTTTVSGSTLMNVGIQIAFYGDYDSEVIMIEKQ